MENEVQVGYSQRTSGANGLITSADCIGLPSVVALAVSTFAPNCYLYQRDATTNFVTVVWQNTGTTAAPAWTQVTSGAVITAGTTKTLTAQQTGAMVLLDQAGGSTVTLPAPKIGLKFTFIATATGAHKVITDAGTTFMLGMVVLAEASAATALGALFNGTTHLAITMNGTTTGGILGTRFTLECVTATQWEISGLVAGSGSLSTPAATS